jgi:hypothetical protein
MQTSASSLGLSQLRTITYVADNGQTIEITPHNSERFDVTPLGLEHLIQSFKSEVPEIQITLTNANAPRTLTGLDKDGPLNVNTKLTLLEPILAYGLVDGGWLPLPFAYKRIALLDRNILITLEKLYKPSQTSSANLAKFLGLDTETLSPMLFVLEGANRLPPTDFQMRSELNRAVAILSAFFPGAKIERVTTRMRKALLRMVLDHTEFRSRATRLLVQAAPLVVDRAKPQNRQKLEIEVIRIARTEGVRIGCLTVLALLSCIYDGRDTLSVHRAATPGRAVLKPKRNYTEEDAYNALADMFFLELMCLVSCDHLPRRSWPLFRAKAMLGDLIAGFSSPGIQSQQEQSAA